MLYSRSLKYFIIICLVLLGLSAGFLLSKATQAATVNFNLLNDGTASSLIGSHQTSIWHSDLAPVTGLSSATLNL